MDRAKIVAVLVIFVTLIGGGVFLIAIQQVLVGSNMITAGISFVTGAGVIVNQSQAERKRRESLLPSFGEPDRKNGRH